MCDRFSLTASETEVTELFQIDKVLFPYRNRFNLVPTEPIPVIVSQGEERCLEQYRWGFFPFWAKDAINAESETVYEKRAFRRIFVKHRCIIPCDGFYGWKTEGKIKQPLRFVLRNRNVFGLAGLYDVWKDPRGNETRTCTVLTTSPNRLISDYHERMPVILDDWSLNNWLDPKITNPDLLCSFLRPYDTENMTVYPVAAGGGSMREKPELIQEINSKYALIKE